MGLMPKEHTTADHLAAIRGLRRQAAIEDGSLQNQPRSTRVPDGRKQASKKACRRGKHGYMDH